MILQVNKMYYPDIGGVETTVQCYSEYLSRFENVVVLCIHKSATFKTKVQHINGVTVYRCSSLGTFMSMPLSLSFFWYLFKLSRKARVIHFHEPFPLASIGSFLVPKRRRIIVTWHSDIVRQKLFRRVAEFFQVRLCKRADKLIATSERIVEYSRILKKFKHKVTVIPLSIDSEKYKSTSSKEVVGEDILNLPEGYVLFFGRLSYYKGLDVLLRAIDGIEKNIPFVIAGTGEMEEIVRKKLRESRRQVYFINRIISEEEKKILIQRSKFLVFPSTMPSEAFGIVQLEAMVYGKPVINTNLPTGVPWVSLHNVSGLTVEPGDAVQLARAIEELYFNEELYNRLSRGALERFHSMFDSRVTLAQLHELYFSEGTDK